MSPLIRAAVGHTSVVVRDLEQSIAFYRDALGYTLAFRDDDLGPLIASMVGQPGLTCALVQLRPPGDGPLLELIAFPETREGVVGGWGERPMAAGQGHVGFEVDDLDAAQAAVAELGAVPVGAATDFPDGRSAYWQEPGGSTFELSEPLAEPQP